MVIIKGKGKKFKNAENVQEAVKLDKSLFNRDKVKTSMLD